MFGRLLFPKEIQILFKKKAVFVLLSKTRCSTKENFLSLLSG